jgi:outer membrane lipoprotein SlyB
MRIVVMTIALIAAVSFTAPASATERGAIGGAVVGGTAGALVGGPVGAVVGAGAGAVVGGGGLTGHRYYHRYGYHRYGFYHHYHPYRG